MKIESIITLGIIFLMSSCGPKEKSPVQKASFGIYETIKIKDIPGSELAVLKKSGIRFVENTNLPIVGYISDNDSVTLPESPVKVLMAAHPSAGEENSFAIFAVKESPAIDNSDIQKTKNSGNQVEIHFNMIGAKKWAELTKTNTGNMVAFVINGQVYASPMIIAEIKSGVAVIAGLTGETEARNISEELNAGRE